MTSLAASGKRKSRCLERLFLVLCTPGMIKSCSERPGYNAHRIEMLI